MLRFLSREDVIRALPMAEAIDGMKAAYRQLSTGRARMPLRGRVAGEQAGVVLTMPAYLEDSGALGIKLVSVFPQNTTIPIIHALVIALDPATGQPLAILEGGALTAIRTGAGSGAATDVLALPDASAVAVIGSGVQARTQLAAVCAVRRIEQVFIYSPTSAHRFAEEMRGVGAIPDAITVTESANEAVQQAQIVCTATTSAVPVFDGAALQPGTHINAVGSYTPTMQEVDEVTLRRARIYVDSRESVLAEAGELIMALASGAIAEEAILAEIGEVIAETATGRTSRTDITYFKSCGVAVQDAAAAAIALRYAEQHDIGTFVEL
ncbi:MAG: ornithine cyclodeaminase [Anaerolineae bacterium]